MGLSVLALAVVLSGCVPIPVMESLYVPNLSDVTSVRGGSGCAFNEARQTGTRPIGTISSTVHLTKKNEGTAKAQALLYLRFNEPVPQAQARRISINPARITLHEAGRTLKPRLTEMDRAESPNSKRSHTRAELAFPAPSGVAKNLTNTFAPGVITIGGRPVDFAPIRFKLKESPLIYMFPCIPT